MSGVLAKILASKEREVAAMREASASSPSTAPSRTTFAPRPIVASGLRRASGEPLRLIAEIKRRSPSAGPLSTALSPAERALRYRGASMISVLCDGPFFDGSFDHLSEVRAALDAAGLAIPLLAKEFVIDVAQIALAASRGADAVLLIARIVPPKALRELFIVARERGLEPLVEVVTPEEVDAALGAGAAIIGVNARDLDTLVMDAERAARVLEAIPADRIAVHLSGLKDAGDVRRIARTGAHAALVGEALMREADPAPLLASMLDATGA